jgi:hypothetical protein
MSPAEWDSGFPGARFDRGRLRRWRARWIRLHARMFRR